MTQNNHLPAPEKARAAIRDLMKRTGLPLARLARNTMTPQTTLRRWMLGEGVPREAQWESFWGKAKKL